MLKKIICTIGITSLLVMSLSACGNNNSSDPVSTATDPVSTANDTSSTENSTESSTENISLNYVSWMTKGEDLPVLDSFMEENSNIRITNQSLDGSNYEQLLNTMMLGGSVPDVFLVNPSMIPDLVKNGYIKPLDGIAGIENQSKNQEITRLLSVDGETYGFAINGSIGDPFVYYNTLFFEEHNLEIPTTLEEFEQLLTDIAALGETPLAVSPGDLWSAMYSTRQIFFNKAFALNMVAPHNAELSILTGETKLSDLYRESFEKLSYYMSNDWISKDTLSMGWEQSAQYLVDGGAQLFVSGPWVPSSTPVAESEPEVFELGAFPLPYERLSDGNYYANSSVDRVLVLSANSENPEAAQKFFEYFISDDVLREYLESQGLTGMNIETVADPVFEYSYKFFNEENVVLNFAVMSKMPPGYNANVNQYAADIYTGSNVDELLERIDADYEAAMSTVDLQEYIDAIKELQNK